MQLLTRQEAADRLRISLATVARMLAAGDLPSVRVGRRVLIEQRDLDAYIRDRRYLASAD